MKFWEELQWSCGGGEGRILGSRGEKLIGEGEGSAEVERRRIGRKRGRRHLGKKIELGRKIRMIRGRKIGKGWELVWWKGG